MLNRTDNHRHWKQTTGIIACGLVLSLCGCRQMSQQHNSGGVSHYQQGNYQGAIAGFQQALTTDPTNGDAYYNLAASYHQLAKQTNNPQLYTQAEQLYNSCLDRDPNNVECHRALAVLLVETNRQDKAFTLMNNWATAAPQLSAPRVELARLYEEKGDTKNAASNLAVALQNNPNDPRALAAMGRLREQTGDVQQALANYQRAYQLNPTQPGVAERLAALQRSGFPTTAPVAAAPAATAPGMSPVAPQTQPGTRVATPPVATTPRY